MKTIITILFAFICSASYAQTDIDLFCSKIINESGERIDATNMFRMQQKQVIHIDDQNSKDTTYVILKRIVENGSIAYYFGKNDKILYNPESMTVIIQRKFKLKTYCKCGM